MKELEICAIAEIEREKEAKLIKLYAQYLSSVKWENKSLAVLEAVRKAYIEAHGEE